MAETPKFRIAVCRGASCAGERDGDAVHARLARLIDERALHDVVVLDRHSCFGRCRVGPNVHVRQLPSGGAEARVGLAAMPPRQRRRSALYNGVCEQDAVAIIDGHVLGGEILHRLIQRPVRAEPDTRDGEPRRPGGDAPRLVTPLAAIELSPPASPASDDSTDAGPTAPPAGDGSDTGE